MIDLTRNLLNSERVDLRRALPEGLLPPAVALLDGCAAGGGSLLDRAQAVMDAVLAEPPAPPACAEPVNMPWWSPMPALYMAALFQHVALPQAGPAARRPGRLAARPLRSAALAREEMRRMGVPFRAREHAVALIASQGKPLSLAGGGAPAETVMRLACGLDVRSLCRLRQAELRASGARERESRLEAFQRRAEQCGVLAGPPAPPVGESAATEAGFTRPAEVHRALNAARYFRLVARMNEPQWHAERLRLERARPARRMHLLIGPAGTGKSSWATENLSETGIISSDRMRRELTGDPTDQSQNYLVFQRCMDRVREYLHEGREVTFDATNCSEALRFMPVQAARWAGAEIVSCFFDVGLSEALQRNARRPRSVPEDVIRRQFRRLRAPGLHEADRHVVVAPGGGVTEYWPRAAAG